MPTTPTKRALPPPPPVLEQLTRELEGGTATATEPEPAQACQEKKQGEPAQLAEGDEVPPLQLADIGLSPGLIACTSPRAAAVLSLDLSIGLDGPSAEAVRSLLRRPAESALAARLEQARDAYYASSEFAALRRYEPQQAHVARRLELLGLELASLGPAIDLALARGENPAGAVRRRQEVAEEIASYKLWQEQLAPRLCEARAAALGRWHALLEAIPSSPDWPPPLRPADRALARERVLEITRLALELLRPLAEREASQDLRHLLGCDLISSHGGAPPPLAEAPPDLQPLPVESHVAE